MRCWDCDRSAPPSPLPERDKGRDTMPRQIDVTLQKITCNRNGFGGAVQVSGDVFGETFQNAPNDPAQSTGAQDIFPFPSGPISLTAGETHTVKMDIVRFNLLAQSQDAPGDFP